MFGDEEWRVVLTTPSLAPEGCGFRKVERPNIGLCWWNKTTIYIDAGAHEDLLDTLIHELCHVPRYGEDVDRDHEFINRVAPFLAKTLRALGAQALPPLPEGWKRLRRSSRIWRGKKEWS